MYTHARSLYTACVSVHMGYLWWNLNFRYEIISCIKSASSYVKWYVNFRYVKILFQVFAGNKTNIAKHSRLWLKAKTTRRLVLITMVMFAIAIMVVIRYYVMLFIMIRIKCLKLENILRIHTNSLRTFEKNAKRVENMATARLFNILWRVF